MLRAVEFRGQKVLVEEGKRIDEDKLRDNQRLYHLRHGDNNDWSVPVTVENRVMVSFWGSLVATEEIGFEEGDYSILSEKEEEKLAIEGKEYKGAIKDFTG